MAIENLGKFGDVVGFSTKGLVYETISGHPDIFITQFEDFILTPPNMPEECKNLLHSHNIKFREGDLALGSKYPHTAKYNAVVTTKYFIHNLKISDPKLFEAAGEKTKIHVPQGYTRCNLLTLNDDKMITSDKGIYATLTKFGIDVLYVNPDGILLQGFNNGFIGGTCGILGNSVFFMGSLNYLSEGKNIERFIRKTDFEIIELYDGSLFDGGGIFFLE